jgi:hypothetical protein
MLHRHTDRGNRSGKEMCQETARLRGKSGNVEGCHSFRQAEDELQVLLELLTLSTGFETAPLDVSR